MIIDQPTPQEAKSKEDLEKEKLTVEIANLRAASKWHFLLFQNVKFTEWLTVIAAVVLAIGGWWTGFFNATRISLENQRDKLDNETAIKTAELEARKKELDEIRKKIEPLQRQEEGLAVLRNIKQMGYWTIVFGTIIDGKATARFAGRCRELWGVKDDFGKLEEANRNRMGIG